MTMTRHSGVTTTLRGRTDQITRGYRGMADEMKRNQVIDEDCDQPQTLEQALRVIADLKNKLADAQNLIDDMRSVADTDGTDPITRQRVEYWDSKRVAKESGVAICTICRNAAELGGTKLGGDWLFPVGTTYGHKRKRKSK